MEETKALMMGKVVLVRDHHAGIHVGTLVGLDVAAKCATLTNARKVHYWTGAASCHGIAARGIKEGSRVAPSVDAVVSCDVVEVVLCSEAGATSVLNFAEWRP